MQNWNNRISYFLGQTSNKLSSNKIIKRILHWKEIKETQGDSIKYYRDSIFFQFEAELHANRYGFYIYIFYYLQIKTDKHNVYNSSIYFYFYNGFCIYFI